MAYCLLGVRTLTQQHDIRLGLKEIRWERVAHSPIGPHDIRNCRLSGTPGDRRCIRPQAARSPVSGSRQISTTS